MKISELISELSTLQLHHGDVNIMLLKPGELMEDSNFKEITIKYHDSLSLGESNKVTNTIIIDSI